MVHGFGGSSPISEAFGDQEVEGVELVSTEVTAVPLSGHSEVTTGFTDFELVVQADARSQGRSFIAGPLQTLAVMADARGVTPSFLVGQLVQADSTGVVQGPPFSVQGDATGQVGTVTGGGGDSFIALPADTYIESHMGVINNYRTDNIITLRNTDGATTDRTGILFFGDTAPAIPQGAEVHSATLTMAMHTVPPSASQKVHKIFRVVRQTSTDLAVWKTTPDIPWTIDGCKDPVEDFYGSLDAEWDSNGMTVFVPF